MIVTLPIVQRANFLPSPTLLLDPAANAQRLSDNNEYAVQYYTQIKVGSDGQLLSVQLDTGSSILWLISSECVDAGKCPNTTTAAYNPMRSTTFKSLGNSTPRIINYVDGSSVTGYDVADSVACGPYSIQNQQFLLASYTSDLTSKALFGSNSQGLMGLAWEQGQLPDSLKPYYYPEFIWNLIQAGAIVEPMFSIWLNGTGDGSWRPGAGGEIVFGGVDQRHFEGEITYYQVTDPYNWAINLSGLSVNMNSTGISSVVIIPIPVGVHANFDTGTSLIKIPQAEYSKLMNYLYENLGVSSGASFSCVLAPQIPSIAFQFGDSHEAQFTLSWRDFVQLGSNQCTLGFDVSESDEWVLGDVFMRRYYTVFHYGTSNNISNGHGPMVGLATAANTTKPFIGLVDTSPTPIDGGGLDLLSSVATITGDDTHALNSSGGGMAALNAITLIILLSLLYL